MLSLAVTITSHNRKKTTLKCLKKLFVQENAKFTLDIFLVDDGSTDGTAEAVAQNFPDVNILKGDGDLYWTGGMRKAMSVAMKKEFDFIIWLNDDTLLYPNALDELLMTYKKQKNEYNQEGVVVGSLCDPETGNWTYGASKKSFSWYPLRFDPIIPKGIVEEGDNFWGNVVLIPRKIVKDIGSLDEKFVHGGGDHDYALKVKKEGYHIWSAPEYAGECSRNPVKGTWKDSELSLFERYKKMHSLKAMDLKTRYHYTKSHGGVLFPFIFIYPYLKLPFSHLFSKLRS